MGEIPRSLKSLNKKESSLSQVLSLKKVQVSGFLWDFFRRYRSPREVKMGSDQWRYNEQIWETLITWGKNARNVVRKNCDIKTETKHYYLFRYTYILVDIETSRATVYSFFHVPKTYWLVVTYHGRFGLSSHGISTAERYISFTVFYIPTNGQESFE